MTATKIAILGCSGRMGRLLVETGRADPDCRVVAGVEGPGSKALGQDLGALAGGSPLGLAVTEDARAAFALADVAIDFTVPAASLAHAALAAESGTALVIGTTGLSAGQLETIGAAAARAPILRAANVSLGVTLLLALVEQAAVRLPAADYDIEILEMHHRHKVDAPSGTALALGEAAAAGRGVSLEEASVRVRDGHTGPREAGTIGFATLRGGDVAGDHSVIFAAEGERLELGHRASNRAVFAKGAIRAAKWLAGRPNGLYAMKDVLGL
ncbi:dihydrodipicolinate reductase [Tistlia consotensis]|uniref:4-hydroxy-tetrahydrodipicolinate reductase n=1 Tax=Tistlia consotensis USBA 355 TaxID=560819 RepID=A0A1Y6BFH8_9PROT|nr:4-hydroxy-tetrahydrodipicolinate reductase [Tistlia consotensis]SMF08524.1 dihydrodipicolinate reductase [Tistlia consotensis USBA 355]SNR35343.1 dihydrodipicolinate reductase [Tistlia consotensis]